MFVLLAAYTNSVGSLLEKSIQTWEKGAHLATIISYVAHVLRYKLGIVVSIAAKQEGFDCAVCLPLGV